MTCQLKQRAFTVDQILDPLQRPLGSC